MSEPTAERVISIVSSMFEVSEVERTLVSVRLRVEDTDLKARFVALSRQLHPMNLVARLVQNGAGTYVVVNRMKAGRRRWWLSSPWVPRGLFAVAALFVLVNGYYRTVDANSVIHIGDPLETAAVFTLALLGILGVHELGHMAVVKLHGLRTTWPYFIPGFPVGGIPTFGAIIFQSKGITINREILFDVAIAGPLAGLLITVLVTVYGAYTAPVIPAETLEQLYGSGRLAPWDLGEPLIMTAALAAFGKGGEGSEVLMTPLLFAAWIGFLITFLNLLPAWQLDGGHMARTLLGEKLHKITTYASVLVLIWPLNFWFMGLMILLFSVRSTGAYILDDISPLPSGKKYAYAVVAVLAVLCAPLPEFLLPI